MILPCMEQEMLGVQGGFRKEKGTHSLYQQQQQKNTKARDRKRDFQIPIVHPTKDNHR